MSALTADRNTPRRAGDDFEFPMLASTTIFTGALVALDADGYAKPGVTATDVTAVGVAQEQQTSGGANGDTDIAVRKGVFRFANDATDTVDKTHIGATAYIVDDQTVAANDGSSTRSAAGTIVDVDSVGVWVRID